MTNPLKIAVSQIKRECEAVGLTVQSTCQAAVDIKERAGDRAIGELKLSSRQPASHGEWHLVLSSAEPECAAVQSELIVADVVAKVIVQQSHVVAATAAPIELHKIGDVWIERVPLKDDSSALELKLIEVAYWAA